jgi:hypothetical protein
MSDLAKLLYSRTRQALVRMARRVGAAIKAPKTPDPADLSRPITRQEIDDAWPSGEPALAPVAKEQPGKAEAEGLLEGTAAPAAKVLKPAGFAGLLGRLEDPALDRTKKAEILKRLETESGQQFHYGAAGGKQSRNPSLISVVKVLEGLAREHGGVTYARLASLPPDQQAPVAVANWLVNSGDEVTYQLATKGTEGSGADWYDQDLAYTESGLIRLADSDPALAPLKGTLGEVDPKTGRPRMDAKAQARQTLFKAVMAVFSGGTNPKVNVKAAYRCLAAAAASDPANPFGVLSATTSEPSAVQNVEEFLRPGKVVYGPGGKPYTRSQIVRGAPIYDKDGNPQLKGFTARVKPAAKAFALVKDLVARLGEEGAAQYLLSPHPGRELRKLKKDVELPGGIDQDYPGAFLLGPKYGPFFLNLNRRQEHLTKDLWWSRSWNRVLGNMVEYVRRTKEGKKSVRGGTVSAEVQDAPRNNQERQLMDRAAEAAARSLGLEVNEYQAVQWYFEQQLFKHLGAKVESYSYTHGIDDLLDERGLPRPSLKPSRTPAAKRRADAVVRSVRSVGGAGGTGGVPASGPAKLARRVRRLMRVRLARRPKSPVSQFLAANWERGFSEGDMAVFADLLEENGKPQLAARIRHVLPQVTGKGRHPVRLTRLLRVPQNWGTAHEVPWPAMLIRQPYRPHLNRRGQLVWHPMPTEIPDRNDETAHRIMSHTEGDLNERPITDEHLEEAGHRPFPRRPRRKLARQGEDLRVRLARLTAPRPQGVQPSPPPPTGAAPPQPAEAAPGQGQPPVASPAPAPQQAQIAFSGNTDEGLSFESAWERARSGNQKAFRKIAEGVLQNLGVKGRTQDAVGDWSDGAENSVLQTIDDPPDRETIRYAAAWYGLLGNQKAVLAFYPQHDGADSVYTLTIPHSDLRAVRQHLDQSGIPFRTLVPKGQGVEVVVYDEKRQLRDQVAQFAGIYHAGVREATGSGEFIGGSSRTAARSKYRKLIDSYESAGRGGPAPAGPGGVPQVGQALRSDYGGPAPGPAASARRQLRRWGRAVLMARKKKAKPEESRIGKGLGGYGEEAEKYRRSIVNDILQHIRSQRERPLPGRCYNGVTYDNVDPADYTVDHINDLRDVGGTSARWMGYAPDTATLDSYVNDALDQIDSPAAPTKGRQKPPVAKPAGPQMSRRPDGSHGPVEEPRKMARGVPSRNSGVVYPDRQHAATVIRSLQMHHAALRRVADGEAGSTAAKLAREVISGRVDRLPVLADALADEGKSQTSVGFPSDRTLASLYSALRRGAESRAVGEQNQKYDLRGQGVMDRAHRRQVLRNLGAPQALESTPVGEMIPPFAPNPSFEGVSGSRPRPPKKPKQMARGVPSRNSGFVYPSKQRARERIAGLTRGYTALNHLAEGRFGDQITQKLARRVLDGQVDRLAPLHDRLWELGVTPQDLGLNNHRYFLSLLNAIRGDAERGASSAQYRVRNIHPRRRYTVAPQPLTPTPPNTERSVLEPSPTFRGISGSRPRPPEQPHQMARGGVHSPAGGVVVRGVFYPGGKWIPNKEVEKASYEQYRQVQGQRVKYERRADGSTQMSPAEEPVKLAKGEPTPPEAQLGETVAPIPARKRAEPRTPPRPAPPTKPPVAKRTKLRMDLPRPEELNPPPEDEEEAPISVSTEEHDPITDFVGNGYIPHNRMAPALRQLFDSYSITPAMMQFLQSLPYRWPRDDVRAKLAWRAIRQGDPVAIRALHDELTEQGEQGLPRGLLTTRARLGDLVQVAHALESPPRNEEGV